MRSDITIACAIARGARPACVLDSKVADKCKAPTVIGDSSGELLGRTTGSSVAELEWRGIPWGACVGMNRFQPDSFRSAVCTVIPTCIDHYPCAQYLRPMDMMRQGWWTSLFQAKQQWSTMSPYDEKMRLKSQL